MRQGGLADANQTFNGHKLRHTDSRDAYLISARAKPASKILACFGIGTKPRASGGASVDDFVCLVVRIGIGVCIRIGIGICIRIGIGIGVCIGIGIGVRFFG